MTDKPDKPSLDQKDVSDTARQFWKLWQKSSPPDVKEFVRSAGPLSPVQLAAVLCVDLRERWKRQQRVRPEDYLSRFAQILAEPEAALDVVYCDFLLRDEQGEHPSAAEYTARFPQLAVELGRQIEMHRLLQASDAEVIVKATSIDAKAGSFDNEEISGDRAEPAPNRPVGKLKRVWSWGRRNPGWATALVLLPLTAIVALGVAFRLNRSLTAADGKPRVYSTILGREFRRLPSFNRYPPAGLRAVVFHPSGNLLFAAAADGLVSIDMNKNEAQALPLANGWTIPIAFDAHGGLITESAAGFQSWPDQAGPARPDLVWLGPPKYILKHVVKAASFDAKAGSFDNEKAGKSRKRDRDLHAAFGVLGSILAIPDLDSGTRVLVPNSPGKKPGPLNPGYREIQLGPQQDVHCCAVSPNGRWVATGSYYAPGQPGAVIWDAQTGTKIQEIPALPRNCDVGFSPDSRWLVTTGGSCRLWETGTWKPGPVLGGSAFAYAPNGSVLAVEGTEGQVRLVESATGAEIARLTAPDELHPVPVCFNRDGSLLVVHSTEKDALYVWDLRAIRERLREEGQDWNRPALPAPVVGPTQVEMVEG